MLTHVFDLGVAVVAGRDDILRAGGHDLIELDFAVGPTLVGKPALQGAAPATAAVVVDSAGDHVHEIILTDDGLDHEAQFIGHLLAQGLADDIARILDRELDLQVPVPVGVDLELALTNPLGVELDDTGERKAVGNLEFSQSFQDRKVAVPSLRVDHQLAAQGVVDVIDEFLQDIAPAFLVGQKETVVLTGPHHRGVGPVGFHQVQDLP